MGRPLNKKFFANTNLRVFGTAGVGGESIASAAITVAGSYTTLRPTFTFSAPQIAGGVTATGTITSEALTAAVTTAGTGYVVGDLLTLTSAGGSAIAYVATITGGGATGPVGTVNFTGTGASRGSFEALPGVKFATGATAPNTVGGTGTGAELTVTFRAKAVVVTAAGSGYTSTATVLGYVNQGGVTVATIALTTGAAARQNGIKCETQFAEGDTEITTGDIVKQQSARRYKVQTSQGTGFFKLVTTEAKGTGEMSIKATDSDGNTYFVAKLTSRKVVLVPAANVHGGTTTIGSQFASGTTAKWTFGAAVVNTTVTIDNQ